MAAADTYDIDCLVIGAGAVGLACAVEMARRGREVLVVEATAAIGSGISSRNSEVIHAGIYYPTDSLRHRLCVAGRRKLYTYLAERNVAHRKCGKLIVATSPEEETQIAALHQRALANDVESMSLLTRTEALALEPNLACVSALLSGETGIIDSHGYMLALQGELEQLGGMVALNAPIGRGRVVNGGFELDIGGATPVAARCKSLINSAGLGAHAIARNLEGFDPIHIPPLVLAKGSYFGCAGRPAFTRLIYPAPVEGGLGVHLTLDLTGRMRFGPDVEWLETNDPARVDYRVDIGRAQSFYSAIRRYWPELPDEALTPDYSGCRPKLSSPGQPAADFRVDGLETHCIPGLVNLFGIESPGLTSSLALGEYVADLMEGVSTI
ncbi:MAG: NAD(P)/FAD-dependent oxidoreductase [Proteobacteria bacterium]|nr:NAD(P)/FAD-dependent oxidoreductase [Pseudomonadota bacterium]